MCRKKIMTGVFRYGKTKTRKPRVRFYERMISQYQKTDNQQQLLLKKTDTKNSAAYNLRSWHVYTG
jgi:hypothetical protein